MYCLKNVLLHRSITTGSWGRGSVGGGRLSGTAVKVVSHLRVKLLGSLLGWAVVAALARSLLGASLASSGSTLGAIGTMLDSGGRLGLSLGLRNTLSQSLGLGNEIGRSNDHLDLERVRLC